jgi:hypothetical protein
MLRWRKPQNWSAVWASIAACATVAILMVVGSLAGVGGFSAREISNRPSGLHVATWYSKLTSTESAYCLSPVGSNSSFMGPGSENIVVTNLTAITGCTSVRHWGSAVLAYSGGTLKDVVFAGVNDSSTRSNTSAHETDYTVGYDMIMGSAVGLWQYGLIVNYNNSTPVAMRPSAPPGDANGAGDSVTPQNLGSMVGGSGNPCPTGGSAPINYIWDGACFVKGAPLILYPHDNMSYYHVYSWANYIGTGTSMYHVQVDSQLAGLIVGTDSAVITAGILGAFIGGVVTQSADGALVGAIIGAVLVALVLYSGSVTFVDESGAMWAWYPQSFITALQTPPPWFLIYGFTGYEAWTAYSLHYLRVGSATVWNTISHSNP